MAINSINYNQKNRLESIETMLLSSQSFISIFKESVP